MLGVCGYVDEGILRPDLRDRQRIQSAVWLVEDPVGLGVGERGWGSVFGMGTVVSR